MRRLLAAAGCGLLATACVWPLPEPGEPVPTIESTAAWSASAGTVTLTVTPIDLEATVVRVHPGGLRSDPVDVAGPPFVLEIDTADLRPDADGVPVFATDGATIVAEIEPVPPTDCNGHRTLCATTYDRVRTLTTHNAMANAADGWVGPNQSVDVPAQLAAGVRGLMLDTYRAGDLNDFGFPQVADVDPDTPYLCHAYCALGSQPLVEGLTEIRTFLEADPGAVVTIIIESYLDHDLTAAAFADAGLVPHAYVHPGGPWPTLGQLVDDDTRLVVFQDETVDPAHQWLMNVWQHAFETHFSAASSDDLSCADNRGDPSNDLFILNHFLTDVFGSPELAAQVNGAPFLLDRALECENVHDRAATFVVVDFFEIGDVPTVVDTLNGI